MPEITPPEHKAGNIEKTLPRSSVIVMIFEAQDDYAVVDSTAFSLFQHNPFSWVMAEPAIAHLPAGHS